MRSCRSPWATSRGRRSTSAPRAPLVGRTRELALLAAALGPVRMGFGTLVELVGDAGIGKSRLLEELRAHAEGMTVLRGACEQYESGTPYFAFRELLREVDRCPARRLAVPTSTRVLRRRLADVAPELAAVDPPARDPARRRRLVDP